MITGVLQTCRLLHLSRLSQDSMTPRAKRPARLVHTVVLGRIRDPCLGIRLQTGFLLVYECPVGLNFCFLFTLALWRVQRRFPIFFLQPVK